MLQHKHPQSNAPERPALPHICSSPARVFVSAAAAKVHKYNFSRERLPRPPRAWEHIEHLSVLLGSLEAAGEMKHQGT